MGMEFYNQLRPGQALSAGTRVDVNGGIVGQWEGGAGIISASMDELGIDISNNSRAQLIPGMLEAFDVVVVMAQPETHEQFLTDFLLSDERAEFWEIQDPRGLQIEATRRVRDEIQKKTIDLVSRVVNLQPIRES